MMARPAALFASIIIHFSCENIRKCPAELRKWANDNIDKCFTRQYHIQVICITIM